MNNTFYLQAKISKELYDKMSTSEGVRKLSYIELCVFDHTECRAFYEIIMFKRILCTLPFHKPDDYFIRVYLNANAVMGDWDGKYFDLNDYFKLEYFFNKTVWSIEPQLPPLCNWNHIIKGKSNYI